jgi:predicted transcriptional regulator of viral defense system
MQGHIPTTHTQRVLDLASRQRLVNAADVRAQGASPQLLIKLHQAGRLQRVARGLYSLPDSSPTPHQALAEVCQRVPKAVVCLLSALQFHDIGTQLPHQVWIALPEGTPQPAVDHPLLRIARFRGTAYSDGIETVLDEGVPIRVYGIAKTVADCFKFRHKIGLDVALEALKDAWRQRRLPMDELTRCARINRVERVMQPYLETLVA